MNTNTTTSQQTYCQTLLIQLPSSHALHHCIGFTPAGIYCKETGLHLTISNKSIKDHIKKHHPNIKGRLENYFLKKLESLVNLTREESQRNLYKDPNTTTSFKWFCSKCVQCFSRKRNALLHVERSDKCISQDLSKVECQQLICKRFFPISNYVPELQEQHTSSNIDSRIFCQPTKEHNEEDIHHIDYSQDFGDELPEIHMGKTDDITDTVHSGLSFCEILSGSARCLYATFMLIIN